MTLNTTLQVALVGWSLISQGEPAAFDRRVAPDEPTSATARVDQAFGTIVGAVESVLFFRIGSHSERYIAIDHVADYVRRRSSDEPFRPINPVEDGLPAQLESGEIEALRESRRLLVGPSGDPVRLGTYRSAAVEFVRVALDTKSEYVFDDASGTYLFAPSSNPRGAAPPARLTDDQIRELDRRGRLRLVALGAASGDLDAFMLSRRVGGVPIVVGWLFLGAIYFTIRMRLINLRGFWHSCKVTLGYYDDPREAGEVSHFQALSSALSGTLGLGNISGVALAVAIGGPGAILWLNIAGLLGMSSKFVECTLGMLYRKVDASGVVSGGPMHYLKDGLAELGLKPLGAFLAVFFAVMCIGGSFGGGCAFQVSQSLGAVSRQIPFFETYPGVYGLILAFFTGIVIIGGIRRIAAIAEKTVPFMCGLYIVASLYIIAMNYTLIDDAFRLMWEGFLTPGAAYGGFIGVMVTGIQRASFSNEAGTGSASIAHAAAKTSEPVREGIVGLLEPFIDTVVVCTMTGLVIVITGAYDPTDARYAAGIDSRDGAVLTSIAFATEGALLPWLLAVAVVLFAYCTLIAWSYYGERCWTHLFGPRSSLVYKILFLAFTFLGSIVTAKNILSFGDLMILSMAFPNILGAVLLSGKVRLALDDYWRRFKAGEFEVRK